MNRSEVVAKQPLLGRVAVVTGAARGLGRAFAERLAYDGAHVVIADIADATGVEAEISRAGHNASAIVADVSKPEDVTRIARLATDRGGADILVHNAGIYPRTAFDAISLDEWRRVMAVNFDSIFLLTKAFLPGMRARQWGRIIGVATGMFHLGLGGCVHYAASKGGVIGFVRCLAPEVGADRITVNAIAPGIVRTEGMSTGIHDGLGRFDWAFNTQAIKATLQPADLAGTVAFLASDDAAVITGQTILVDGGLARA